MRVEIQSLRLVGSKIAVLLSLLLCGCTIVHIEGGQSIWSVRPGVLRIEPRPGGELLVVRTEGIGVTPAINGVNLGYLKQTFAVAYSGSRCQVIIFTAPDRDEDAARLAQLLAEVPQVCRAEGGRK